MVSDVVAEQMRSLKDELRDIRIVASTRQEAQPINLNMALDTSSIDRAAQSLQDMTREALTQIREDVQNMPIVIPAPQVKIENIMPEFRAEAPTVNVVNQVQPAQVTVVDNHPQRAEQIVVRDKNDEIIKTVTTFIKE